MSNALDIGGGGYAGLLRAVEEVRRGGRVDLIEPRLRAGGAFVTESFLSPFRFNLGPTLVQRPPIPSLHVLEPSPLLAVGDATLGRARVELRGAGSVAATLTESGVSDPRQRTLLMAFAVLSGIDPEADDSGARLAAECDRIDDLVVVSGGNGLAVACMIDEIIASGSSVVEGVGDVACVRLAAEGLGLCRMFVGLRGRAPSGRAVATAVGFDDERSLLDRLAAVRSGDVSVPLGFVIANGHLDANHLDERLESFVWQGVLPFGSRASSSYTDAVLAAVGVDPAAVVFQLLWDADDTGEPLG